LVVCITRTREFKIPKIPIDDTCEYFRNVQRHD
jgi:hypothetical protein